MPTIADAVQAAASRFIKNAKELADCQLDGSPKSLLPTSAVMQKFHTLYVRAAAAKDPDLEKFVHQVSTEAAAYVSTVFINHFKAQLGATKEGKLILIVQGVNLPILDLMADELKTGKPHSLLLLPKFDEITQKNTQAELLDSGNLPAEAQTSAAVAVQDVRAMLKQELDYSLESFAQVDRALLRLKAIAEVAPENKGTLVRASCDKYGAYIGEALIKNLGGKWQKIKIRDTVVS